MRTAGLSAEDVFDIASQMSHTRAIDRSIVIVPCKTDRHLLLADLERRPVGNHHIPENIFDYSEVDAMLQSGRWDWELEGRTAIVCQVNLQYSAAFALVMIQLMAWADDPTTTSCFKILTISEFASPERPLEDALPYICPDAVGFYRVTLQTVHSESGGPVVTSWKDSCFVDFAIKFIKSSLKPDSIILAVCPRSEAIDIIAKLRLTGTLFSAMFSDLPGVDALFEATQTPYALPPATGIVFFLTERPTVRLHLDQLTAVLVSDTHSVPRLIRGRTIIANEGISTYERTEWASATTIATSPR
ncbi:hypothetical protein NQ176_g6229 [Zarea fungicola]|uniref:Uncharacterized protein n=1 Tax=Zarea fungicola TaxID=93591 RepID=A0ACC1N4A6_9HYPO|nr:hypothetical protein NQ176_g6229 [Lecanicillium fungicola]